MSGRLKLPEFFNRTLTAATIACLIGVGALYLAAHTGNDANKEVIREFGAVLLTIGVIGLFYEAALRRSVINEMYRAVNLAGRIAETGLEDLTTASTDWGEFLSTGKNFAVLPLDPVGWLRAEWSHVLDQARAREIIVDLYLPKWDGDGLAVLAQRLAADPTRLGEDVRDHLVAVRTAWLTAQSGSTKLSKGCQLTIHTYEVVPAYGIAIADRRSLISVPATAGMTPGGHVLAMQFGERGTGFYRGWLCDQLKQLEASVVYTNKVG